MQGIPEEFAYLLRTNVLVHVSLTEADGSLVTHVMGVDYDGEHTLTSSPTESYKSRAFRGRPQVAVSVIDPADPWRRLSISGRVTEIRDDEALPSSTSCQLVVSERPMRARLRARSW